MRLMLSAILSFVLCCCAPGFARAEPTVLAVIGDSLARQYCRGFRRLADKRDDLDVRCWVTPSSGLSRPDFHDWPADISAHLASDGADIAVVAFGANDAQRVIFDGAALDFGSADWLALYRDRVGAVMTLLGDARTEIYWVGLPTVRSASFAARLRKLDDVYIERAAALGATYVDMRAMTAGSGGGYTANLPDARGRLKRARDTDGVHYTRFGETMLARAIMKIVDAQSPRFASN